MLQSVYLLVRLYEEKEKSLKMGLFTKVFRAATFGTPSVSFKILLEEN